MSTAEFVAEVFQAATGKLPTFTSGDSKWKNIVASGNRYIRRWAREPKVDWESLRDPAFSIGNVTATDSFDLDSSIRKLSQQEGDTVRIVHAGGVGYTDYDIVDANRLRDYQFGNYCAKIGSTLRFNNAFTATSQQFGGTITVPAYLYPDPISDEGDEIPVDDPDWLVLVCAADYVRNDVTRKDLRADLISEANDCMERMKSDNEGQVSEMYAPWSPTEHLNND